MRVPVIMLPLLFCTYNRTILFLSIASNNILIILLTQTYNVYLYNVQSQTHDLLENYMVMRPVISIIFTFIMCTVIVTTITNFINVHTIAPETRIISVQWAAYKGFRNVKTDYTHDNTNDSNKFRTNTKKIDSLWSKEKRTKESTSQTMYGNV